MTHPITRDEHWRAAMEPVMVAVAQAFGITVEALRAGRRKTPPAPRARKVCCWLSKRLDLRLTDGEIYRCLGLKHASPSRLSAQLDALRLTDEWLCSMTDRLLIELQATTEESA